MVGGGEEEGREEGGRIATPFANHLLFAWTTKRTKWTSSFMTKET